MPTRHFQVIERDFRRVHKDVATVLLYKGVEIPAIFNATDDDVQMAPDGGGELAVYTLICTAVKSDFPTPPAKGEIVEVEGETYQIGRPQSRPGSPLLKLYFTNLDT